MFKTKVRYIWLIVIGIIGFLSVLLFGDVLFRSSSTIYGPPPIRDVQDSLDLSNDSSQVIGTDSSQECKNNNCKL